jgi:hydroxymethylbilane synthase
MTPLRIGTRGSPLALWQAQYVADQLRPPVGTRGVELVPIVTSGDQVRDRPLAEIGGGGAFTKEIQRAVLDGTADVAVHSLKDLPTFAVEGLVLAAVPPRGPTGDVLVSRQHQRFDELPPGATLATGSLRRRAQALHRRPDLHLVDVRGNVETRLRKLAEQGLDALILAEAGLKRLGHAAAITEVLDPAWMLPAVGQGALGLECRADDGAVLDLLRELDDLASRRAVLAERALLRALGGGCQVPIGAAAAVEGSSIRLWGAVLRPDGQKRIAGEAVGSDADEVGGRLARELLERGARELLGAACGLATDH